MRRHYPNPNGENALFVADADEGGGGGEASGERSE